MNKFLQDTIIPSLAEWFPDKNIKLLDYSYQKYVDKISFEDNDGYKYCTTWSTIKKVNIEKRYFSITCNNKYATENVKLYLSKHYPDIKLVSEFKNGVGTFEKDGIKIVDCISGLKDLKFSGKTFVTYDLIYDLINDNGFEPVMDMIELKGNLTKLYYRCSKHGLKDKTYQSFKDKSTCNECDLENFNTANSILFKREEIEGVILSKNKNVIMTNCGDLVNNKTIVHCKCKKHTEYEWDTDIRCIRTKKYICKLCAIDARRNEGNSSWKGGITPIHNYLRNELNDWKYKTIESCDYKCLITGKRFDVIHHKHSFSLILKEALDILEIEMFDSISDYTNEQLLIIRDKVIELHNKYGFGACLTEEYHKLFHLIYGYGNNTIEQWNEFYKNHKL